jgi:hypothetical protein
MSRRVHFQPSRSSDTAVDVAKSFHGNIFNFHGLPDEIVFRSRSEFPSKFWLTIMALCGFKPETSSVRHPQTECSSVTVNGMLANYIKFYCSYRKDGWAEG